MQQPRIPLQIAAHGPKPLRLAAWFGDGWNSFYPGASLTPKEASNSVAGWVSRLEDEAGIREFAFFYLPGFDFWEHQCISTPEWLIKVSRDLIPRLRKQLG